MELEPAPPLPGPLLGREHLSSAWMTVVVLPLALGAYQGIAYGQPMRGTLTTLGLLALTFVARLGVWAYRRDRTHQWEHKWSVLMIGRLQTQMAATSAEVDELRAKTVVQLPAGLLAKMVEQRMAALPPTFWEARNAAHYVGVLEGREPK